MTFSEKVRFQHSRGRERGAKIDRTSVPPTVAALPDWGQLSSPICSRALPDWAGNLAPQSGNAVTAHQPQSASTPSARVARLGPDFPWHPLAAARGCQIGREIRCHTEFCDPPKSVNPGGRVFLFLIQTLILNSILRSFTHSL